MVGRFVGWSVGQLVSKLVGWSVGRLVGQVGTDGTDGQVKLAGWLAGFGQVGWLVD